MMDKVSVTHVKGIKSERNLKCCRIKATLSLRHRTDSQLQIANPILRSSYAVYDAPRFITSLKAFYLGLLYH